MTRSALAAVLEGLTARDLDLLRDVATYRLLTTKQIQRLHFDHVHPTPLAAARACTRALTRLRDVGVVRALERRIGGVRAGSAGFVWFLGPTGERLLRSLDPDTPAGRRNYREPSRYFVEHTLAVAEIAIQTLEASRTRSPNAFDVLTLKTEPASWQASLGRHGTACTLKPDLWLIAASGDYEHHWFIEIDLATEHLPVIRRQCEAYQAFRMSGRYQAKHGLFPAVLWIAPNPARAAALRAAVRATDPNGELFTVCTAAEYRTTIGIKDESGS